ncbi:MAG: antA/AntB antirepressor family protein [Spirochaetaceae bacterium]|nr:antA/AntB antirepressor family protein [Spirochaetaceae bacterium]MBO7731857.1 antA/AntB antirepressor family protein [Methanobrevibacter sp.]
MNEIKVSETDGNQTVSARDLHEKLEIATAFKDWFPRICEYGFQEGFDFNPLKIEQVRLEGSREVKRELIDYAISIEMAKQICMLQRNDKGREYREYFLKIEKAWNSPEAVMARALQVANKTLENVRRQAAFEHTKRIEAEASLDRLTNAHGEKTVQEVAKILGYGSNNFFSMLRGMDIFYRDNGINLPKQQYINSGYFFVKAENYTKDGKEYTYTRIFVTAKGMGWLEKKLKD